MASNTENTLAQFDEAKHRIWKLLMAIMKTVQPDFDEPEPE